MPAAKVLLVCLASEEVAHVQELLSGFEMETGTIAVSSIEASEPYLVQGDLALVILRVDEGRPRPDQDVHRVRRLLSKPVPVLVLVPPNLMRKVKDFLRTGADEYWILPLDFGPFPPRLYVLLEWGQSVLSAKAGRSTVEETAEHGLGGMLVRVGSGLRRLMATVRRNPTAGTDLAPEIAGRWEKVRKLGFGSFGEVWLVRNKVHQNLAVAKIPHTHRMNTKFVREAAILKRLEGHPNAIQFIEVVKEQGKVILIQEYAEGPTLQELLDQRMSGATKESAVLELLAVVAYAHQKSIMHRDIKPENVIITPGGHLKLLDFGTSKDLTRNSISSTVIGSRPYMAPEQIMGKSRIASDVWALGVILYALATELLPFYDENEKQLMDLILEVSPQRPRNLEPELAEAFEAIILKCLEKDWTRRYPNAAELRADLLAKFPHFGAGEVLRNS